MFVLFCKITAVHATEISPLIGVGQENYGFAIGDIGQNKKQVNYEPNIPGVSRLSLSYDGYSLGYSFRGSGKDLDPQKGSTDFFDSQLGYQNKNWGIDAFFQSYQGFFTSTTQTIQLFPDLKFVHAGLMGRYSLSEGEFSVSGLMDQSEEVKTTSGKYYIVGGLRQHIMQSSISLMQQDYAGINPELENLRKMKVSSVNLGVGAGKYWVSSNHFFIGALLDLVGTLGQYTYENGSAASAYTDTSTGSYGTLSYDFKAGFGYSGSTFKTGLGITADVTTLKTPGASFLQATAARALWYLRLVF